MAHVAIDTNLWDTEDACALGDALRDRDAWRFLVRIWAWGIDSDCSTGRIVVDAERLKSIAGFVGDADEFLRALIDTGWLKPTEPRGYRMRGWDRNKRFFEKKKQARARQKAYREKKEKDASRNASRDALHARDVAPDPTPSPTTTRSNTITNQSEIGQTSLEIDTQSKLSVNIQTVWGAYREYHPHCAGTLKSSRKEYKLLAARLKDGFTIPQLIQAVQGYHVNPYHCGENDTGTKYQSFELIMRNSVQVENGIRYANGTSQTKPKPQGNYAKVIEELGLAEENGDDENERLPKMHGAFAGLLSDGSK